LTLHGNSGVEVSCANFIRPSLSPDFTNNAIVCLLTRQNASSHAICQFAMGD
jgi:hypothetical protein